MTGPSGRGDLASHPAPVFRPPLPSRRVRSASHPLTALGRSGEQGRLQLLQISGEATALGFEVLPTGMVILGPGQLAAIAGAGPGAPAMAEELQLQAIMFTEDLWAIMLWVSEADVAAGEQLMALCAAHGGPGLLPLSDHLDEHIFDGAWNNAGTRPVGYHHRPGGSPRYPACGKVSTRA